MKDEKIVENHGGHFVKEKYSKFEITTCPVTRKGIPKYCSARSKFKTSRGTLPALRVAFISIVTYSHERTQQ